MSTTANIHNLYMARLTTQDRPCFVCSKFTNVVLTSADNSNSDWFYVCRSHLADHHFCSKIGGKVAKSETEKKKDRYGDRPPESDSVVELVSSIGNAWKSWRGKKKEEHEEKEEHKEKEKEEHVEKEKEEVDRVRNAVVEQPVRFVIQRDYFYLRQREQIKKIQKKEAADRLRTLQFPDVPKKLPTLNQH